MLTVGENSYVSLEDANEYFAGYIYSTAWDNADDFEREKALITATKFLDSYTYRGEPIDPNQKLQMPRNYKYINSFGVSCSLNPIPRKFIECVYRLAIHMLSNEDLFIDMGWVETIEVSSIALRKIHRPERIPSDILEMLSEFCFDVYGWSGAGDIWWRRN